jgi:hypothetical protein
MSFLRVLLVTFGVCLASSATAQHHLLKTKFVCKAASGNAHALLHELVSYCGVNIEYSPSNLDTTKRTTLPGGETTLGAALNKILKGQRVNVIEKNNKIIIATASSPLPPDAFLEKHVLFGFIQQEGSREPLPYATVRDKTSGVACESNIAGFYSMELAEGVHTFEISFTGFSTRSVEVDLAQNTRFNLILSPITLPEIQVNTSNTLKRDAGNKLDNEQTGIFSNMLGETDPVRAVYLLPGNMESQESGGKLIVRGGEPGQSLLLLDGNPVFNPAHLLGEISVVNNTSIKSLRQYKNDFPSRYSGGISSITAINTKDGNMQRWTGEAAIGFSSAAVSVEGPLKKDRTALMVSARHSLGDAGNNDLLTYDALFSDFHLKLTHQINKNNKLMISGYTGDDRLQLTGDNSDYLQKWSNGLFTINLNTVTGKRSFANTTLNFSSFDNYVALKYIVKPNMSTGIPLNGNTVFNNYAAGNRFEAKTAFELTASPFLQFQFGGRFENVRIQPYTTLVTTEFEEDEMNFLPLQELSFNNFSVWYENEIRIGQDLLIRPGIHANSYATNNYNNPTIQPRFFASYRLNNKQQIHVSYSHIGQWLHQVTSPYPGINRELWLPANERLLPALSKMINAGYQYKNSRVINFTADIYYKQMTNLVNFSEKANVLFYNESIEKNLITGKGKSYGIEMVAERKFKKWKALLSYTLSWSWRRFDSVNNGKEQPYRYDRRNNLNILVSYQPKPTLEVSALWHFHTGDWITTPSSIPSNPNESYTTIAPYRGKAFNRVNLNTTFYLKPLKIWRHKLSAGVHIMGQPSDEYSTQFSAPDNTDYDIDLFPDQLFKYSWYISYNISF